MSEVLEATMLVCFGLSWPMNLIKNIRAKSARNMSLQFILLIILGYVAGITAKLLNHKTNYVLAVYILNLVVVSANVIVYIINRRYDMEAGLDQENVVQVAETAIEEVMATDNRRCDVLLFGGNSLSDFDVDHMKERYAMNEVLINDSIDNLSIDEAIELLPQKVKTHCPTKLFVSIGENDMSAPLFDADAFIEKYEWLLYRINDAISGEIYILPLRVGGEKAAALNNRLSKLAKETGCTFLADYITKPFETIRTYARTRAIRFEEAMLIGTK